MDFISAPLSVYAAIDSYTRNQTKVCLHASDPKLNVFIDYAKLLASFNIYTQWRFNKKLNVDQLWFVSDDWFRVDKHYETQEVKPMHADQRNRNRPMLWAVPVDYFLAKHSLVEVPNIDNTDLQKEVILQLIEKQYPGSFATRTYKKISEGFECVGDPVGVRTILTKN